MFVSLQPNMSTQEMIKTLADYFATQPVTKAWLFGSYARGEQRDDSDVDILVDFDKTARVSLLGHIRIMHEIQDLLDKDVDLVTQGTLLPAAEQTANRDKKLIYERAH